MFQVTKDEYDFLKSQFATSKSGSGGKQKQPLIFTENGVAMLSSVLSRERAIKVNIAIMRTFTKLRSFLVIENSFDSRIGDLESTVEGTHKLFRIVFERLDSFEEQLFPKLSPNRKKIGLSES